MSEQTIRRINEVLYFTTAGEYEKPALRPWQYVQMEYEKVGMMPPADIPDFSSIEEAQIWMCLDAEYNTRLREGARRAAGPVAGLVAGRLPGLAFVLRSVMVQPRQVRKIGQPHRIVFLPGMPPVHVVQVNIGLRSYIV